MVFMLLKRSVADLMQPTVRHVSEVPAYEFYLEI